MLSWTGTDYMHNMLKHNRVRLPNEAYAMLKLFPLVDWHMRGKHASLSSETDEELKLFVADLYDMFQRSRNTVTTMNHNRFVGSIGDGNGNGDSNHHSHHEMSDKECKDLWTNHYSLIAHKYGAGGDLRW